MMSEKNSTPSIRRTQPYAFVVEPIQQVYKSLAGQQVAAQDQAASMYDATTQDQAASMYDATAQNQAASMYDATAQNQAATMYNASSMGQAGAMNNVGALSSGASMGSGAGTGDGSAMGQVANVSKMVVMTICVFAGLKLLMDLQDWWLVPLLQAVAKKEVVELHLRASGFIKPILTALAVGSMFLVSKSKAWLVSGALFAFSSFAMVFFAPEAGAGSSSWFLTGLFVVANAGLAVTLLMRQDDGNRLLGKAAAALLFASVVVGLVFTKVHHSYAAVIGQNVQAETLRLRFWIEASLILQMGIQTVSAVLVGAFFLVSVLKKREQGQDQRGLAQSDAHNHESVEGGVEGGVEERKNFALLVCGGVGGLFLALGVAMQAQALIHNVGFSGWALNEPVRELVAMGQVPALLGLLLFGFGYLAHGLKEGRVQAYVAAIAIWVQVVLMAGLLFSQGVEAMIPWRAAQWVGGLTLVLTGIAAVAGALSFISVGKATSSKKLAWVTAVVLVLSVGAGLLLSFGLKGFTGAFLGQEYLAQKLAFTAKIFLSVQCGAFALAGLHHLITAGRR